MTRRAMWAPSAAPSSRPGAGTVTGPVRHRPLPLDGHDSVEHLAHTSLTEPVHHKEVTPAPVGTIVVVEDDQNIADLVELYLRQEGFRVVQAHDGQKGLDAVR